MTETVETGPSQSMTRAETGPETGQETGPETGTGAAPGQDQETADFPSGVIEKTRGASWEKGLDS